MLKRVLTLISVTLLLVITAFVGYSMYLVYNNKNVEFTLNPIALAFIFCAITMILALLLTGFAYRFNNKRLLIIGTLLLAVSTIPNIIAGMNQQISDPFLLTKLIAPSFLLNLIMLNLYSDKYEAWEKVNINESRKSHYKNGRL